MKKQNELSNREKLQAVSEAFGDDSMVASGLVELFGAIEHLEAWLKSRHLNKRYKATNGSLVSMQRTFNCEFKRIMKKYNANERANAKAEKLLARRERLLKQLQAVEEKLS